MRRSKVRRQIALEAARLIHSHEESEYPRAKQRAAFLVCQGWVQPADLPSDLEIRDELQAFARLQEPAARSSRLRAMRLEALAVMRALGQFRPRLTGALLAGDARPSGEIELHLFANRPEEVLQVLDRQQMLYDVERRRSHDAAGERLYTLVHVQHRVPLLLTIFPADQAHHELRSAVSGRAIERASIGQLQTLLAREYPETDLHQPPAPALRPPDRFQVYHSLLLPLENVVQNLRTHPEGDALYHSLQVFVHARDESPYDEEFLLAALLHDVGKAIDPQDHVAAGLEALDGFITDRTRWFIEHHSQAQQELDGLLGVRARRRLKESPDYDDLLVLARCDRAGRQRGARVPELEEALAYLRELAQSFDE